MPRTRAGNVRLGASGKWQARITDPADGKQKGIGAFDTEQEAWDAVAQAERDLAAGQFVNPEGDRLRLAHYAAEWLDSSDHANNTLKSERSLLRNWILPHLGRHYLNQITPVVVRKWNAALKKQTPGSLQPAKAYRLLSSIMETARFDGIRKGDNPCMLKGAGVERSPERLVATPDQVFAIAGALAPERRALILLAAFGSLRLAEVAALERRDIDVGAGTIRIERATDLNPYETKDPKGTDKGTRTILVPPFVMEALLDHLRRYVDVHPTARVFRSKGGRGPLRNSHWNPEFRAALAATEAGLPERFTFHCLRHTGQTFYAESGATLPELMARAGQTSSKAAQLYIHARESRQRQLIDRMTEQVLAQLAQPAAEALPTNVVPLRPRPARPSEPRF